MQWRRGRVGRTWPLLGGSEHGRESDLDGAVPAGCGGALAAAYLQRQLERARTGTCCSFALADPHDVAVGQIGLWLRDLDQGRASIGYWIPTEHPDTLIYLLAHTDAEAAAASWDAFRSDPEWKAAKAESEQDGPVVLSITSSFLEPTDFSELR